jgi:hypothetical protein
MSARGRPSRTKRAALAALAALSLCAGLLALGAFRYARPGPTRETFAKNFELVAVHALDGRPAFKPALQVVAERWYLYAAHFWDRGWSVLDVTEPSRPELVIVDARGYAYLSDKNQGLYVVRARLP